MISRAWLKKKKELLAITVPGEPRDRLAAEIAEAEAQLAKDEAELGEVLGAGFRRNSYSGTCKMTGEDVGEMAGFVRKESGRWVTNSWGAALEMARQK